MKIFVRWPCTIKVSEKIYVVHAFQKKSKSGIKTPMEEIDLISKRLKLIKEIQDG
jgi:phage-related protein